MTTPNLAPCPFCGGTDIASTEDDDELIAIFCSGCSAGSGYCQTWDEAAALWNARVGLPSRAWEMGRDAALDQLTPPATLARPEPNETQRGPAGNDPDRPGGGSTSSGERRASVPPRPEITDEKVNPVYEAMLSIARPDVFGADLWDLSRAALTAALNPQETPDAE